MADFRSTVSNLVGQYGTTLDAEKRIYDEAVKQGLTPAQIASAIGGTESQVNDWISKNVTTKPTATGTNFTQAVKNITNQHGTTLDAEKRIYDEAVKQGLTPAQIASAIGGTESQVNDWISKNVTTKPTATGTNFTQAVKNITNQYGSTPDAERRIYDLANQSGATVQDVAGALGSSTQQIMDWISKQNLNQLPQGLTPGVNIYMPGTGSPVGGREAQQAAMGSALHVANTQANNTYSYPGWYGGSLQGPTKYGMSDYVNPGQLQQSQALMDGDYNRLEQGLMAPIKQQWNDDQQNIKNMYGANGLYGSLGGGMMSGALADAASKRDVAMGNATANRYALQMKDMDRMDNNYLNQWKSNYANAGMQNDWNTQKTQWDFNQNENVRNFNNSNVTNRYNYDIDRLNWQTGIQDNLFNKYSTLSGMGNAANAQNLAARTVDNASNANMWAGIGTGVGNFLGSSTGGGLLSSAGSALGNLWDGKGFELFSPSTWW